MKKCVFLLFAIGLISLFSCNINPEAYKSARSYFGLKLDKQIKPTLFEENWNMKGEGEVYIIYTFDSISNELFLKKNKLLDYEYLPIKEKTPLYAPEAFSNYIPSDLYHQLYISDSHGFIVLTMSKPT